ncbi:MAG: Uma2 family endonuclease, partial [Deltaproteobacteria bacterium]|nr:Uma2 family endonuclease [Deltaproteobacteria bacterium]
MSLSHSTTTGAARGYPRRMGKTPNRATYEDLLALDEQTRAEVVEGRVVLLPSTTGQHQYAVGELGDALRQLARSSPNRLSGWWILSDLDVLLAEQVILRPDLVGWRRERLASPRGRPIDVRPDWVCEVVSPSNASHDLVTKRRLY